VKVIEGLKWPPDRLPYGEVTIAIVVAPLIKPIGTLRAMPLEIDCRTIDAGCCSSVVAAHATKTYESEFNHFHQIFGPMVT
jgi:hypothetical protein